MGNGRQTSDNRALQNLIVFGDFKAADADPLQTVACRACSLFKYFSSTLGMLWGLNVAEHALGLNKLPCRVVDRTLRWRSPLTDFAVGELLNF